MRILWGVSVDEMLPDEKDLPLSMLIENLEVIFKNLISNSFIKENLKFEPKNEYLRLKKIAMAETNPNARKFMLKTVPELASVFPDIEMN